MNKEICLLGFIDKEKRERIGYYLFFSGIMLELLVMVTDNAANFTIPYRGRLTHVAFLLFCIKILSTKYKVKEWLTLISLTFIACISYLTCDDEYVIRVIAFLFAAKGIELDRIFRVILVSVLVSTLVIATLSFFDISGSLMETRHFGRGDVETRYMFGFNHANNVHDILWFVFSLVIMINKEKLKNLEVILFGIANFILYLFTRSRTGFIAIMLLVLLVLFIKNSRVLISSILLFIISIVSFVCTVGLTLHASYYNVYTSRLVNILDPYLTGRLQMLTEHAFIEDWTWFPEARSTEYVDNGFSTVFYCYGIVIGILLLILILKLIYILFVSRDDYLAVVLIGIILVLFMESTFIINVSLLFNMLILIAADVVWKDDRINDN